MATTKPPMGNNTVLRAVTAQIDSEIGAARKDVDSEVRELTSRLSIGKRPVPGVSRFTKAAVGTAILVALAAALTLTPARKIFTTDHVSWEVRSIIFVLGSMLAAVPGILRITPMRSISAQAYLITVATAMAAAGSLFVISAGDIVGNDSFEAWSVLPAGAVVATVLFVSAWSLLADRAEGTSGLLGWFTPLASPAAVRMSMLTYVFWIVVLAANRGALEDDESWSSGLLHTIIVVAVVLAVAGGLKIVIVRRDRRVFETWKYSVDESVDRCEAAAARVVMLRMIRSHWLATAAVVARMYRRPYGTKHTPRTGGTIPSATRKLGVHELELSQRSKDTLVGSVIPSLFPRGWMAKRYRAIADLFVQSERRRLGITDPDGVEPPEHCTYNTSVGGLPEAGTRREFCDRVYDGDYDEHLRADTDQAVVDAMRAMVADGAVAEANRAEGRSVDDIVADLVPTGAGTLPAGIVPPGTDGIPKCVSYVWMPEGVDGVEGESVRSHESSIVLRGTEVIMHGVRVDISEPMSADRLRPLSVDSGPAPSDGRDSKASPAM